MPRSSGSSSASIFISDILTFVILAMISDHSRKILLSVDRREFVAVIYSRQCITTGKGLSRKYPPVLLCIDPAYATIKEDKEENTALRKITRRIILGLTHACRLVGRRLFAEPFKPEQFHDSCKEELKRVVERKIHGKRLKPQKRRRTSWQSSGKA
jgi:hypothetical protein